MYICFIYKYIAFVKVLHSVLYPYIEPKFFKVLYKQNFTDVYTSFCRSHSVDLSDLSSGKLLLSVILYLRMYQMVLMLCTLVVEILTGS